MSIEDAITESFRRSFMLYDDLVAAISESRFDSKLPQIPSNSLGLQLWCVVGARESYSHAIEANAWSGFTCSLATPTNKAAVADALRRSAALVTEVLETMETFTEVQNRLILDLLEHEAAHQGQLIRYIYGLHLPIPESWKSRYALDQKSLD